MASSIDAVIPEPPYYEWLRDDPVDWLIQNGPIRLVTDSEYRSHDVIRWISLSRVNMSIFFERMAEDEKKTIAERRDFFTKTLKKFEMLLDLFSRVYERQNKVVARLRDGPNPYEELARDEFGDYADEARERALRLQRRYRGYTVQWASVIGDLKAKAFAFRKRLERPSGQFSTMEKIFVY